jgi:uncharacterized protein YajQ (UPF0234 family)
LELNIFADDDFKLEQVKSILISKLTKRGVDIRVLDSQKIETVSGNKLKEIVKIKNGIAQEQGKQIVKLVKDSKLKVQGSIQGELVRISGVKRDDLQEAINILKQQFTIIPLQFNNFRD